MVYLDPLARASYDANAQTWLFKNDHLNAGQRKRQKLEMAMSALASSTVCCASNAFRAHRVQAIDSKGIGVDVEDIQAFPVDNHVFIQRNFTEKEREYCNSRPNPHASLTGRWCAKEAVIKAISSASGSKTKLWTRGSAAELKGIEVPFIDDHICFFVTLSFQVLAAADGSPTVTCAPEIQKLLEEACISGFKVSISHSDDYALAMAVAF